TTNVDAIHDFASGESNREGSVAGQDLGIPIRRHAGGAARRVPRVLAGTHEHDASIEPKLRPLDSEPEWDPAPIALPREDYETGRLTFGGVPGNDHAHGKETGHGHLSRNREQHTGNTGGDVPDSSTSACVREAECAPRNRTRLEQPEREGGRAREHERLIGSDEIDPAAALTQGVDLGRAAVVNGVTGEYE